MRVSPFFLFDWTLTLRTECTCSASFLSILAFQISDSPLSGGLYETVCHSNALFWTSNAAFGFCSLLRPCCASIPLFTLLFTLVSTRVNLLYCTQCPSCRIRPNQAKSIVWHTLMYGDNGSLAGGALLFKLSSILRNKVSRIPVLANAVGVQQLLWELFRFEILRYEWDSCSL